MDVGPGRTGADSDTELGAAKIGAGTACELALLDQVTNRVGRDDRDIKPLARFDLLFHRRCGIEPERQRMPDCALALRPQLLQSGLHAVRGQDANCGTLHLDDLRRQEGDPDRRRHHCRAD
jgi:hypothetical protein